MNEECRIAIEDYYTLKHDYDESYKAKRKDILSNNRTYNTKELKQNAVRNIKMSCVNCKRMVGSIFKTENRVLSVKCGDATNPCPLNIKIYKGRVTKLDDDFEIWLEEHIKEYAETIIKTKLDVLFQYITEEEAVKIFQETKENLELYKMGYNTDFQLYLEKTNNIQNKEDLDISNRKLLDMNMSTKELLQQYHKTKDARIIKDVVTLYKTKVMPLVDTIRELKYKYIDMEYNEKDDTYTLEAKPYLIRDLETNTNEEDEPKLISNIK